MKNAVFTVVVDNYRPDICATTIPTIKNYANKINAELIIISERKFPEFPPTYEKLQVYELGREFDHCLLIDADTKIHSTAPDFMPYILPGYVGLFESFDADKLFVKDEHFIKDGRNVGIASNFVLTDKETHELWKPLDISWDDARKLTKREFIIDEYCLSRNLAKHGFKFTGLQYNNNIKYLFHHIGVSTSQS